MSNDENPLTLRDFKDRVRDAVRDEAELLRENSYPEDILHEIADSCVPIYNYELLEVAQSDLWLAVEELEIFAFGGDHTAVGAIAGNLFRELEQVAREEWQKIEREEVTA